IKDYKYFSDKYCIAKFLLKYIAKSYLPESIINRVKKGFPVPFALWDKKKPFTMDLHTQIFKSNDLSCFTAWEKFMIYNLNTFVEVFDKYRGGGVALNCATYYKSLLVLTFYSFTFFRLLILFALFVSYVACLYLRAYLL
ncbi:asparagine synthase-related protein, partial [Helicobacter typhlonius]